MKLIDISTPKFPNTFTMVDDADFDWANQWKWTAARWLSSNTTYAVRRSPRPIGKSIFLHREINKTPAGLWTDHKDGNGLNNQRENLRNSTKSQNSCNSRRRINSASKFKGVYFDKRRNLYQVQVKYEGKRIHLGRFKNEDDAVAARDAAAKKYQGEFARLNVI